MERIPEPELMENEAQAAAYAGADFEEPHARFIERLEASAGVLPDTGEALDLGCGPADIAIRFARAHPGWTVDGVDGAEAMLRHGRDAVARAGLAGRVRLHRVRLPSEAPPRPCYDLVLSNSLLHHLPDPQVLWTSVRRFTRPGGLFFIMDLRRPADREAARALVEAHAAGEPEILRRDFHRSLLAAYRVDEVEAQLVRAGLVEARVEALGDRHLTVRGGG